MLDDRTEDLLIETLRSYGVSVCYLFGSRATGDCRADSDIDLGMVFREFRREVHAVDMEIEIENAVNGLVAPLRADVVFLQRASQSFRFEAITSGVIMYSGDEEFRTDFEYEVVRDYLDFAPVIEEYYQSVKRAVARLRRLAAEGEPIFLSGPDNYAIAEHNLRRAIQAVLDIGSHVISKKGLGKPRDYRDILRLLGQYGIMPIEFTQRVAGMAGYRNRLVHGYAEVTPDEMYGIISTKMDDLDDFCRYIVQYIDPE